MIKVGIPRALFYHSYKDLFLDFFDAIGVEVVLSPETNQKILADGIALSIDESCLSAKIYLGHVMWLIGKCDYIFVPRIENFGKGNVACVKFFAMHDIVANIFSGAQIIGFNIDEVHGFTEEKAYIDLGRQLGFGKTKSKQAYLRAKEKEAEEQKRRENNIAKQLKSDKLKIIVISHAYNACDAFVGAPVLNLLKQLDAEVILTSELACEKYAMHAKDFATNIYWKYNKELVGAMSQMIDKADGIVLITAFPCGPDSLVNELVLRKQKSVPMLNLCVDELQAQSGLETRVESFIDILSKHGKKRNADKEKKRVKEQPGQIVATFPHIGNYHVPFEVLLKRLFADATVLIPPPITKKTLELGSRHSPDYVCVPFKYTLGNMIESLNKGATLIFQAGGGCRFGFYGELQETILKDLGYQFSFLNVFYAEGFSIRRVYQTIKQAGSRASFLSFARTFLFCWRMVQIMDKMDIYIRKNIGFEVRKNSFTKLQTAFHKELKNAQKIPQLKKIEAKYDKLFKELELKKSLRPFKIALVGELYCLMEQNSTYFIEKQLAAYGMEIHRDMSLTYLMKQSYKKREKNIENAAGYLKYHLGADGTHSVAAALKAAREKFDGVVHVKPFGCMPEVNAMPMLMKISEDYQIPILYFSFDTQTSETGIRTRIEAFHDMLKMREKARFN